MHNRRWFLKFTAGVPAFLQDLLAGPIASHGTPIVKGAPVAGKGLWSMLRKLESNSPEHDVPENLLPYFVSSRETKIESALHIWLDYFRVGFDSETIIIGACPAEWDTTSKAFIRSIFLANDSEEPIMYMAERILRKTKPSAVELEKALSNFMECKSYTLYDRFREFIPSRQDIEDGATAAYHRHKLAFRESIKTLRPDISGQILDELNSIINMSPREYAKRIKEIRVQTKEILDKLDTLKEAETTLEMSVTRSQPNQFVISAKQQGGGFRALISSTNSDGSHTTRSEQLTHAALATISGGLNALRRR